MWQFVRHILFSLIYISSVPYAAAQKPAPWNFRISTVGLTYPTTYVWSSTGAPLNVAFLTASSTDMATDACPRTGDTMSCTISSTYPANLAGKFSITYSPSGGGTFVLDNTAAGCTLTLSAAITCYSETMAYSGTTEQIVINMYMTDLSGNCPSLNTRYNSNIQPIVLLVDCSLYTSTTSTTTVSTTTSTTTSTSTTTTPTTTQTTTTQFIQSPGGIATVVIAPIVGLGILAGIGYGIYKCCVTEASVSSAPSNFKEVVYVTSQSQRGGTSTGGGPTMTRYYGNAYGSNAVSRFGESPNVTTYM